MKAADVSVSAGTRERLGESLGEVCRWLWPQDCQTCGQPLGLQQPALCVDSSCLVVTASLHHPACRPADWSESPDITVSQAAGLSWTSRTQAGLPLVRAGQRPDPRPLLLVNPSLEMVFLARAGGCWRPQISPLFTAAGLQRAGEVQIDCPTEGLAASLHSGTVTVRLNGFPFEVYSSPADDIFAARARKAGGLLFGVTQILNPADPVTGDQVLTLIRTRTIWLAWVAID